MLWVSQQVRIPIHRRDSRVGTLSKFIEFQQSSHTRPTRARRTLSTRMDYSKASTLEQQGGLLTGHEALWPSEPRHSPNNATPSYYTENESFASGISKMWCVSSHFHRGGVFIGPWGSSTDLEKLVWHQLVAGWPGGAPSTNFLHCLSILLLV
jgi:hypothetical protein